MVACESKQQKAEKQEEPVQQSLIDSSNALKTAIQGKWYLPGNAELVMEIKGNSVEYMGGFMEVRYTITNNRFLVLFNPDESVDTIETKVLADTLYQREPGADAFTKYTRRP